MSAGVTGGWTTADRRHAAQVALEAAREAARVILRVYAAPFDVEYKGPDDPVTRADREANALLCERLTRAFPGIPIVAEESDPADYAGFPGAAAAWFVDPLDGTREFVARNGEFAVMIGLAEQGEASLGVIVAPAWERSFVGIVGEGAWEVAGDARRPIQVAPRTTLAGASLLVSRWRTQSRIPGLIAATGAREAVPYGSSGLKSVLVATGVHDVYVQPGRAGMRWDACAAEAIVRAAGGEMTDEEGARMEYSSGELENSRGLVATNGTVHDAMIAAMKKAVHSAQ
jgi:3'(2'), 5'-bisphosphate nucleotidase